MLRFTTIGLLLGLASCSSSPFKESTSAQNKITSHMSQPKQYIGGDFDSKYSSSSNDGMTLQTTGRAVYPVATNESLVRANAVSTAKFKLVETAPTEFKSLVQQAIGNTLGYNGEFNKIDTSITEVHALRGVEVKEQDIDCRVVIEPNADGGYNNFKECRAIARVALIELNKAFNFTMDQKYGLQQKSSVEKILEEQLKSNTLNSNIKRTISSEH
jgi:hypothetical protein